MVAGRKQYRTRAPRCAWCSADAISQCSLCGRRVCNEHLTVGNRTLLCPRCKTQHPELLSTGSLQS